MPTPRKALIFTIGLLIFMAAVQVWIVSAGHWLQWPRYSDDYCRLAAGFLHGQLSLLVKPPPALLALPDPYDPAANRLLAWHDAVLFNGNYYLYWGPVPALLIAAVCLPLGISTPDFGDQYLAFAFLFGSVILAAILIYQIRLRMFPDAPFGTLAAPLLSLGLGTPVLFSLSRAAMYETAICAGQFFLLAGICTAWLALSSPRPRPFLLTAAGICWTFSIASRISLPPAIAAITLLTLRLVWHKTHEKRPLLLSATALLTPLLAGAALFACYNFARFHSITEFGMRYQLASINQHIPHGGPYFSARYAASNLIHYLFQPPYPLKTFPYVMAFNQRLGIDHWMQLPREFGLEPLAGLAWTQPFLAFAIVPLLCLRSELDSLIRWLILSFSAAAVLAFVPNLLIKGNTMRYLMDIAPCGTILAAFGYWHLLSLTAHRPRLTREIKTAVRLLVLMECIMGILLAINGMYGHFVTYNPDLYNAMHRFFPILKFM